MKGIDIYNSILRLIQDKKIFVEFNSDFIDCRLSGVSILMPSLTAPNESFQIRNDSREFITIYNDLEYGYYFDGINMVFITYSVAPIVKNSRGAGRKLTVSLETVADLYNQGMTMQYIADDLNVSIGTISNAVAKCRTKGLVKKKVSVNSSKYKNRW